MPVTAKLIEIEAFQCMHVEFPEKCPDKNAFKSCIDVSSLTKSDECIIM